MFRLKPILPAEKGMRKSSPAKSPKAGKKQGFMPAVETELLMRLLTESELIRTLQSDACPAERVMILLRISLIKRHF